jgi:acetylglutamate kinase
MIMSNIDKAKILTQALPYIQEYNNKTVVVKYGGNAMLNYRLKEAVISDLILLSVVGIKVVLVHGGGPEISDMLKRLNIETKFINGLRYTDEASVEVVQMVLAGKTNKDLVNLISRKGGQAIGLSGLDSGIIKAKKLEKDGEDYGYVGDITDINIKPVKDVLDTGYIPVLATIAQGSDNEMKIDANNIGGERNDVYNINADTAAGEIAKALKAESLMLLTDVRGILTDPSDTGTLKAELNVSEIPGLIENGIITGGMIPKVECCVNALNGGVRRAQIIDGRLPHSILIEMLTDGGVGSMITR